MNDILEELAEDLLPACRDLLCICLFAGLIIVLGFALGGADIGWRS